MEGSYSFSMRLKDNRKSNASIFNNLNKKSSQPDLPNRNGSGMSNYSRKEEKKDRFDITAGSRVSNK
jgi:hypothetical protein